VDHTLGHFQIIHRVGSLPVMGLYNAETTVGSGMWSGCEAGMV
jgi:hypothetical protein